MSASLDDIGGLGLGDCAALLDRGAVEAVDLVQAYLTRIEVLDSTLNAFTAVDADAALAAAEASDARRAGGEPLSPLDGAPIAVMDNIDVAGLATSVGLGFRAGRVAQADAMGVAHLKAAGCVILGKTNMPEGAMGVGADNAHFGRVTNPWGAGLSPGGASSGAAAAVAGALCPAALATDTMGSTRIPAAFCGVAGFKPTQGLVSSRGIVALSHTLDGAGLITRRVRDLAPLLSLLARYDPACPESRPGAFAPETAPSLAGRAIGVFVDIEDAGLDPTIAAAQAGLAAWLVDQGARRIDLRLGDLDLPKLHKRALILCEVEGALAHEADLSRHAEAMPGPFVDMMLQGGRLPALQVARARRDLAEAGAALRARLHGLDAAILPTTPGPPFPAGSPAPPGVPFLASLANMARVPALSLPVAPAASGPPSAMTLLGPEGADGRILALGALIERGLGLEPRAPFGD